MLIYAAVVLKHFDVSWACIDVGSAVALDIHVLCCKTSKCVFYEIIIVLDRGTGKPDHKLRDITVHIVTSRDYFALNKNQTGLPLLGKAAK